MTKKIEMHKVDLGFYFRDHYYAIHPDGNVEVCDIQEISLDEMKFLVREAKAFIEYCKKRKYPKKRGK